MQVEIEMVAHRQAVHRCLGPPWRCALFVPRAVVLLECTRVMAEIAREIRFMAYKLLAMVAAEEEE